MGRQRSENKPFDTKELNYKRFNRTVDAYAHFLAKGTKAAYPEANDKAFVEETILSVHSRLLVNEPEEGAVREALDRFDLAYKLGSSIREAIVVVTRQLANALRAERKFMPKFAFKRKLKRWKGVPLPWIDHLERHDEQGLESRIYRKGKTIEISPVRNKAQEVQGQYNGRMTNNPTSRTVYRFLVVVYASRKLKALYEQNQANKSSQTLIETSPEVLTLQIKGAKPVEFQSREIFESIAWFGSQSELAALLLTLEKRSWIAIPSKSSLKKYSQILIRLTKC